MIYGTVLTSSVPNSGILLLFDMWWKCPLSLQFTFSSCIFKLTLLVKVASRYKQGHVEPWNIRPYAPDQIQNSMFLPLMKKSNQRRQMSRLVSLWIQYDILPPLMKIFLPPKNGIWPWWKKSWTRLWIQISTQQLTFKICIFKLTLLVSAASICMCRQHIPLPPHTNSNFFKHYKILYIYFEVYLAKFTNWIKLKSFMDLGR